jgi:hypothetical protein
MVKLQKSLKKRYAVARKTIQKRVISNDVAADGEPLDIVKPFKRSKLTLGEYVVLDWNHKQDIKKLKKAIRAYERDPTRKRPLNILMLAEPGSGKSHFIRSLADKMGHGIAPVTFNMATVGSADDLVQPLDECRNHKVQDRLPILFLDEFDSKAQNYPLLLPLLWDGEIHASHRDLTLGKVVIVLAGSTEQVREESKKAKAATEQGSEDTELQPEAPKLRDLLSRINCPDIDIPGLDLKNGDRDRRTDKVCIAISLLQRRFTELQCAPWALLNFIARTKFTYSSRSIASIIDLIPWSDDIVDELPVSKLELPLDSPRVLKKSSLRYHITEDDRKFVVDRWHRYSQSPRLVRFKAKPEMEEE